MESDKMNPNMAPNTASDGLPSHDYTAPCPLCPRMCPSSNALTEHIKTEHPKRLENLSSEDSVDELAQLIRLAYPPKKP